MQDPAHHAHALSCCLQAEWTSSTSLLIEQLTMQMLQLGMRDVTLRAPQAATPGAQQGAAVAPAWPPLASLSAAAAQGA